MAPVEGATHIGEVGHPDQSLSAEQQLLSTSAERHIGPLAERNHDVRETVLKVELVDEGICPASHEATVESKRSLPFGEETHVGGYVKVGAQPESGKQVCVGVVRLRGPEQEVAEVLCALPDLPAQAQPHALVPGKRDELQPVPEVIRRAQVHPPQDRPVSLNRPADPI